MENFSFVSSSCKFVKGAAKAILFAALLLTGLAGYSQAPTVSYTSPQTFYQGLPGNVTPTSSNAAPVSFSPDTTISANVNANGITHDASNNLYFTSLVNHSVSKFTPGSTAITLASGFNQPEGLAVDANGNIYVADAGDKVIKEIPAGGGAPITIASGLTTPTDVAVDASGNVFFADYGARKVEELPGGSGTPVTIGSGFTHPTSLKFDKAGNLFIADATTNTIYERPAGGGAQIAYPNSIPGNITYIAVDPNDNIFFTAATYPYTYLYMAPAGGGAVYLISQVSKLTSTYVGITVDDSDNIYFSDPDIVETRPIGGFFVAPALPAGLSFNQNTGAISGTPTNITPAANYIVRAYNANGSSTTGINIQVTVPPPPTISYKSPKTVYYGNVITPIQPTATNVGAFSYAATIVGSGFKTPTDEVVDAVGNIYIADPGNFEIKKIPASGGTPLKVCSGTPHGITLDGSGNIYFSQASDVYKVAAGSSTAIVFGSGLSPNGIAADAPGDVYVAEPGNNDVKKIPAGGGTAVVIATGFSAPADVALDAAGNLYIADYGNSVIKKMPASGGAVITIATLSFKPESVAADGAGNIYADGHVAGTYQVILIPAGGSGINIGSGFSAPLGLAVDKSNNLYVADSGNNEVKKFSVTGGYFITPVLPVGLVFNNATGTISGTPSAASPATNYTITAYNYGGSASATLNLTVTAPPLPTISYPTPQNYAIGVAITPLSPASSNVYPFGYSSTITTHGSGFNLPTGVAHDGAGNIYVADNGNNVIKEIPSAGGTPVIIGSGFSHPVGVVLDALGNIYVADAGNNAIKKIPAGSNTPVSIGSGFNAPTGVAADLSGNLFIADAGNNAVKEIPAGSNTPITLASGFNDPYTVALDGAGYIYVVDVGNSAIKRIPPGGGTPVVLYNINGVYGVAISPGGNLYYSNTSANSVVMIPAGSTTAQTIATGFNSPVGLSVNGAGDVYIADEGNNIIKEVKPDGGYFINPFLPAGLSFNPNTGVISGTPTIASPSQDYSVTAYNVSGTKQATVNIAVSANGNLANLSLSAGTLSPAFTPGTTGYTASVGAAVSSIKVTPTAADPAATIKVNGTTVASGAASGPITLNTGANTITIVVTAAGGSPSKTYTVTVGRGANDAYLAYFNLNRGSVALTPAFAFKTLNYTASVPNTTSSVIVTPSLLDANGSVTVNGTPVANKTASAPIPLAVGPNVITIVGTAQDGVTTETYTVTVTRASGGADAYQAISVSNQNDNPLLAGEEIKVHQGVSPNGDGINDVLTIDNITNYPQNKLMIMDRNGAMIYQAKGYDNLTKAFDGHSNITGRMQLSGTYFYALDYTANGVTKRKTGFIVLKY